jgi:hypothetical protein
LPGPWKISTFTRCVAPQVSTRIKQFETCGGGCLEKISSFAALREIEIHADLDWSGLDFQFIALVAGLAWVVPVVTRYLRSLWQFLEVL